MRIASRRQPRGNRSLFRSLALAVAVLSVPATASFIAAGRPPTALDPAAAPQMRELVPIASAAAEPTAVRVAATPAPTRVTQAPVTPAGSAQAMLASIRADYAAKWVQTHSDADFRGGPSDDAPVFNQLPQWSTVKVLETRPGWLLIQYEGDGDTRQPGPGWIKEADAGAVPSPIPWLLAKTSTPLWSAPDATGTKLRDLTPGVRLEIDPATLPGPRLKVRTPGNGRETPPSQGWIDVTASILRSHTLAPNELPWSWPASLDAAKLVRLPAMYRTQLDGTPYAEANCGPTVLGMALEMFGVNQTPLALRGATMRAQNMSERSDDSGSFIWALSNVAVQNGVRTFGLYEPDGTTLRRWTTNDIRGEITRGNPVVLQVRYRTLPKRESSLYYGDHYILITGLLGNDFLYQDPIGDDGEEEGPGFDRVIDSDLLFKAMNASDRAYAYTGFALSK